MLKKITGFFALILLSANVLATPAGDNILISEVAYDVVGSEPAREWFELYNPTASPIDISGWTITDGEGTVTVPVTTIINAGDYFLAAHTEVQFHVLYPAVPVGLAYGAIDVGSIYLANGGDSLSISDLGGNEVDFVAWKNKVPNWNIEAAPGKTITRKGNLDTDLDDDWASEQNPTPGEGPGFTLNKTSISMIEGSADTFSIVLDAQPTSNVVIDITTSDAAAVSVVTTSLTFMPANWNIPQIVNITGVEDDDDLFDEAAIITATINVAGSDDMFDNLIDQTLSVVVINNDLAKISIDDVIHDEAHSGNTDYTFMISIDYQSPNDVTVEYATADGSATLVDNDYVEVLSTSVTIPVGQTSVEVTLQSTGDTKVESDETFVVNLSNPTANAIIEDSQGDAIISNDDAAQISIADVTLNEGTGTTSSYNFVISIDTLSDSDITVEYATADGSATSGDGDYTAVPITTATISAGTLSTMVTVQVAGDAKVENTEIFLVTLINAVGASIADSSAMGIITNDDTATLSIDDVSHTELDTGNMAYDFTVSIDNPSDSDITFKYKTSNATATSADNDYLVMGLTNATIPAGDTSTTITVQAKGDVKVESDEQFNVELSDVLGAIMGDSLGVATIVDNDVAGFNISPTNLNVDEGDAISFNIVLTAQPLTNVTFKVDSSDHGAASFDSGLNSFVTLTFTPENWDVPQHISITAIEDADLADESVQISALVGVDSDPAFSVLSSKAVTVVVNDDDIDTDNDGIADEDDPDIDNDGNPNGTDPNPLSPVSTDDFVETMGTEEIVYNILNNDDFVTGVNTRLEQVGGTAVGGVSLNVITGELSYTPDASEVGSTVTLDYQVCNIAVNPEVCDSATITMSIAALPIAPPSSIPTLSEWMLLLLSALLLLVGLRQSREKHTKRGGVYF